MLAGSIGTSGLQVTGPGRVPQEASNLAGKLMPHVLAMVEPAAVSKLTRYKGLRSCLRMLEVCALALP